MFNLLVTPAYPRCHGSVVGGTVCSKLQLYTRQSQERPIATIAVDSDKEGMARIQRHRDKNIRAQLTRVTRVKQVKMETSDEVPFL